MLNRGYLVLASLVLGACMGGGTGERSPDASSECSGCTSEDGVCETGRSAEACGTSGAACEVCARSEQCNDGACEPTTDCSPESCAGCCDGGRCVLGDGDDACGQGGFACEVCSASATCVDHACTLPCEATCDGCCIDGTCVEGSALARCGQAGEMCVECPPDSLCVLGSCVSTSCADRCDGCCDGDACISGDSASACGSGGTACSACSPGFECSSDGCVPDPRDNRQILVRAAIISETDHNGDRYDGVGLPDPYVVVEPSGEAGRTAVVNNSTAPIWSGPSAVTLRNVPAERFDEPFLFQVWDSDALGDDLIANCELRLALAAIDPYSIVCSAVPGLSTSAVLRVQIVAE